MIEQNDEEFRQSCRTYLLTYSQADQERFPDCRVFSDCVLEAFNQGPSKSVVEQCTTCKEQHSNSSGIHFHMCLKLSSTRRWKPVFDYLQKNKKIIVNFSSKNCGYLAAYHYACKDKPRESVLHSFGHPNLTDVKSPPSKKGTLASATKARKRRRESSLDNNQAKEPSPSASKRTRTPTRLTNACVAKFLVDNEIRSETALMATAKQREIEG